MTYSDTLLTVEHQTIVYTQHELEQEQEYEQQLQDARNGLGDLALLPEANPNKLDSYVSLPKQTKFNTCSHGHLYKEGIKTHMTYHDDGSGDWVFCSDDPDYEQYIMAGNPTHVPANPLNV